MLLLSSILFLINSFFVEPPPTTYTLEIEITNVKSSEGTIYVSVYDKEESYNDDLNSIAEAGIRAKVGVQTVVIDELPPGEYAFKLLHDENDNEDIDFNFFGIPTEGYAFSNNAEGFFGQPKFEDAEFMLKGDVRQKITLIY